MAITVIPKGSAAVNNVASKTITATNVTPGNTLICLCEGSSDIAVTSVKEGSTSFVQDYSPPALSAAAITNVYRLQSCAGGASDVITVTYASANFGDIALFEVSGLDANPFDATTANVANFTASASTESVTSGTSHSPNAVFFALQCQSSSTANVTGVSSGWTLDYGQTPGTDGWGVAHTIATSATKQTCVFTSAVSAGTQVIIVGYKGAPPASTITIVNQWSGKINNATSGSITANIGSGHSLIALVATHTSGVGVISVKEGSTAFSLATSTGSGATANIDTYYLPSSSGGSSDTVTVTYPIATNGDWQLYEVTGLDPSFPIDITSKSAGFTPALASSFNANAGAALNRTVELCFVVYSDTATGSTITGITSNFYIDNDGTGGLANWGVGHYISSTPSENPQPTITISGTTSNGAGYWQFIAFQVYMPPVPQLVATSPSNFGAGWGPQNHLIYAVNSGRWWAFAWSSTTVLSAYYSSGTALNDAVWTAATTTLTTALANNQDGRNFAISYANIANTDVIHVGSDYNGNSNAGVHYHARGHISGTTITWDAADTQIQQATSASEFQTPGGPASIILSTGKTVDATMNAQPSSSDFGNAEVSISTNADIGTSWTSGFPTVTQLYVASTPDRFNSLVDLGSGNVLYIWGINNGSGAPNNWQYATYNGSTWSATANIVGTNLATAPAVDDYSVVARTTTDTHIVWRTGTNTWTHYRFNGSSWAAGQTITNQTFVADSGIHMATDGNWVWLFTIDSDSAHTVRYCIWNGTSWGPWVALTSTSATRNGITGCSRASSTAIGITWVEGTGSPYNIVAASIPLQSTVTGVPTRIPFRSPLRFATHTGPANPIVAIVHGGGTYKGGSGTSASWVMPFTPTAGNSLILVIDMSQTSTYSAPALTVSDPTNGTWTKDYQTPVQNIGGSYDTHAYYRISNVQATAATISITGFPFSLFYDLSLLEVANLNTSSPIDVTGLLATSYPLGSINMDTVNVSSATTNSYDLLICTAAEYGNDLPPNPLYPVFTIFGQGNTGNGFTAVYALVSAKGLQGATWGTGSLGTLNPVQTLYTIVAYKAQSTGSQSYTRALTDTLLVLSDSINRLQTLLRNPADALALLGDSVGRLIHFFRQPSGETLPAFQDALSALQVVLRAATTTLTVPGDSLNRLTTYLRSLVAETLTESDVFNSVRIKLANLTENVPAISNAINSLQILLRTPSDVLGINDVANRLETLLRSITPEILTESDLTTVFRTIVRSTGEILGSTAILSAVQTILRSPPGQTNPIIVDSINRLGTYLRFLATESLPINDLLGLFRTIVRLTGDTIATSDLLSRLVTGLRSPTETATGSAVLGRLATIGRGTGEALSFLDTLGRLLTGSRSPTDIIATSALVSGLQTVLRSSTEAFTTSDLLGRLETLARSTGDVLVLSNLVTGGQTLLRGLGQSNPTLADSLNRLQSFARGLLETLATGDILQAGQTTIRGLGETVTGSALVNRLYGAVRSPTAEALGIADLVSRLETLGRGIFGVLPPIADAFQRGGAQTASFIEALSVTATVSRLGTFTRSLTDVETIVDIVRTPTAFAASLVEALATSDLLARLLTLVRPLGETIVGSQTLGALQILGRSAGTVLPAVADTTQRLSTVLRLLTEAVTTADALARSETLARVPGEVLALTDSLARIYGTLRSFTESVLGSQTLGRIETLGRGFGESLPAIADLFQRGGATAANFTEAITSTATVQRLWNTSTGIVQSVPGADTIQRLVQYSRGTLESSAITDFPAITRGLHATVNEVTLVTASVTRQLGIPVTIGDALVTADSIARQTALGRHISDIVQESDLFQALSARFATRGTVIVTAFYKNAIVTTTQSPQVLVTTQQPTILVTDVSQNKIVVHDVSSNSIHVSIMS